jgi:hypothetical protein
VAYKGLDRQRSFVLLGELDEAAALTTVGLRTLRELRFVVEESAAVLTLLSVGSEKMLKTTMGLAALDADQPWPDKKRMRAWGHNLNAIDAEAIPLYERQIDRSTAPGFIRELIDQNRADSTLHLLLDLLSDWGTQARFHRLDELAGTPQAGEPPHALWEELESRVLKSEPELISRLGDVDGHDAVRRRVNEVLGNSFRAWWTLHTRAWMTGTIGKDAKGLATVLNRVLDARVNARP